MGSKRGSISPGITMSVLMQKGEVGGSEGEDGVGWGWGDCRAAQKFQS